MTGNEKGTAATVPQVNNLKHSIAPGTRSVYVPRDYLDHLQLFHTWGENEDELVVDEDIRLYALRRLQEIDIQDYIDWLWFSESDTEADRIRDAVDAETMAEFVRDYDDLIQVETWELEGTQDMLPEQYEEYLARRREDIETELRYERSEWLKWMEEERDR